MRLPRPLAKACRLLTEGDDFEVSAAQFACFWRQTLRPHLGNSVRCRQSLMAHVLGKLIEKGFDHPLKYPLAVAVSLAMTDRVHALVEEADAQERTHVGGN